MRIFPIITAVLVMSALYMLVFERDRIVDFAGGGTDAATMKSPEYSVADAASGAGAQSLVSVVALTSKARTIASTVLVRGRTEAARQVDVRAETAGQVISEPLRKGTQVQIGQILCQLDAGTRQVSLAEAKARFAEATARVPEAEARLPEARARLAEAKARVAEAQINLRAAERLAEGGFASETRVASAQAAYESAAASVQAAMSSVAASNSGIQSAVAGIQSAQAAVAAAIQEISKLTLTAPFAGILESDAAEIGTFLQPGALCATVIQLDPIKLVGFVPETDVNRIKVGVLAGAELVTGQQLQGQVTFLSRSADDTTRTFRVEIQVPNTDLSIRDGQTAEIAISSDGEAAHLLPSSALTLNDQGDLGIRAVDETKHVIFVQVSVLRDTIDGIWVAGLPAQIDVIVVGQEFVIDGVPVNVAYREVQQ